MTLSITSSTIIEDRAQADGRRAITELHLDDQGGEHRVSYLAEPGADVAAMLPERAAQIAEQLNAPPPPGPSEDSPIEAEFKRQRDAFKVAAIGYVHQHPACTLSEVLAYAQPLAPMISGEYLISLYAGNAAAAGMTPAATFDAFRDFVCGLTLEELMAI